MEKWYRNHGIHFGSVRVRTTPHSVGGRGLFWCPDDHAEAKIRDILVYIPAHCVLTASTSASRWPDLKKQLSSSSDDDDEDNNDPMVQITACTLRGLREKVNKSNDNKIIMEQDPFNNKQVVDWKEWIVRWSGGGGPPRPLNSYSSEHIRSLALNAGASVEETRSAIDSRYTLFLKNAQKLGFTQDELDSWEQCAEIYSVVVSRCANLGPQWGYERGIIPLHDMLNHYPEKNKPSVELFCYGDVRRYSPTALEDVRRLVSASGADCDDLSLSDRDILLVARRSVQPGKELFLSYRGKEKSEDLSGEDRVWLMLQYGFPIASV